MFIVTLPLQPVSFADGPSCQAAHVVDAVWPQATAEDHLEHISVQIEENAMNMVFFIRATNQAEADRIAHRLCHRLLSAVPVLSEWVLITER